MLCRNLLNQICGVTTSGDPLSVKEQLNIAIFYNDI